MITRELVLQALESISDDYHDEEDTRLIKAIQKAVGDTKFSLPSVAKVSECLAELLTASPGHMTLAKSLMDDLVPTVSGKIGTKPVKAAHELLGVEPGSEKEQLILAIGAMVIMNKALQVGISLGWRAKELEDMKDE